MRFGIVLPTYPAGATGAMVEGVLAVAEAAEVLLHQLRPDVCQGAAFRRRDQEGQK